MAHAEQAEFTGLSVWPERFTVRVADGDPSIGASLWIDPDGPLVVTLHALTAGTLAELEIVSWALALAAVQAAGFYVRRRADL